MLPTVPLLKSSCVPPRCTVVATLYVDQFLVCPNYSLDLACLSESLTEEGCSRFVAHQVATPTARV